MDCGGSRCNKCADTKKCTAATDCLSGICTGKVCVKGCKHQPVVKDCTKDASGVEWCKVPGGCFQMGSPTTEMCHQNDETPHQVTLTKNFSIQAKEVTQGQFKNLMGYNPSKYPSCGNSCPVEQVNWHEAAAYCNKLSTNAGYTLCYKCTGSGSSVTCQEASGYTGKGVYSCVGFRLPTEAEWEYAYRAGTSTAFYNGGISDCLKPNSNVDKIAWYCANSTVTYSGCYTSCTGGCCSSCMGPSPVGKKTPNAWGLWDMTGNVTEWGHDWHGGYGTTTVTNPWGVSPGTTRVSRGGSWAGKPYGLRAAVRSGRTPSTKSHGLGFRCLRTAIP